MSDPIYLDNHATTQMDPAVLDAMLPWMTDRFGNPGSVSHDFGRQAREAVEQSRAKIAHYLGFQPTELVFTSGATESNNLAIRGFADRHRDRPVHVLSASTEHKAVLDPLEQLVTEGHSVTLVSPDVLPSKTAGLITCDAFANDLQPTTRLASIMLVNNELGVVQPIHALSEICHEQNVWLHCDATQAVGKIPVNVAALDVDLLSFSGHKMYGPMGVGGLVVRRRRPRIKLAAQILGGGQERGLRSGTANVAGIVGLAQAVELAVTQLDSEATRIAKLRDSLYEQIMQRVEGVYLNGPKDFSLRVPGNLNLRFDGVDGEALMLGMENVAASSGSACTSANPAPSHVLLAIGLNEDQTRSSLRFGIGRFNTQEHIDIAACTVQQAVRRLRSMA